MAARRRKSKSKKLSPSRINLRAFIVAVALTVLVLSVVSGTLGACFGRAAAALNRLGEAATVKQRMAISQPVALQNGNLSVHYIDVGQGDSILITRAGHGMLIDAGTEEASDSVVRYIKAQKLTALDYCIGTHPHEDHIGGMDSVINAFTVKTLILPDVVTNTKSFASVLQSAKKKKLRITRPIPGTTYKFADASFELLAPNSAKYEDLNNYSVVLKLTYGSTSFLFTGDAQTTSEKEMLKKGYDLSADVLKVGHHGSKTSTSAAFLKAVHPKYAVISVGKGNVYGLPATSTVKRLKKAGIKLYRTDENGTVIISSDGRTLSIKTDAA